MLQPEFLRLHFKLQLGHFITSRQNNNNNNNNNYYYYYYYYYYYLDLQHTGGQRLPAMADLTTTCRQLEMREH